MRLIYLPFLFFLISFTSFSQPCGWSYSITASNATIAVQQENFDNMYITCESGSGDTVALPISFDCPVWLGVFYTDDNGQMQCGGYVEWDSTQSFALAAWGDDPTTPEKDGFSNEEPYVFQLCVNENFLLEPYTMMSTDLPFTQSYFTNGFGSVTSLSIIGGLDLYCSDVCVNQTDIHEYSEYKELVKSVDLYGRDISSTKNSGFVIQIFSDQTVSKTYRF